MRTLGSIVCTVVNIIRMHESVIKKELLIYTTCSPCIYTKIDGGPGVARHYYIHVLQSHELLANSSSCLVRATRALYLALIGLAAYPN